LLLCLQVLENVSVAMDLAETVRVVARSTLRQWQGAAACVCVQPTCSGGKTAALLGGGRCILCWMLPWAASPG